MSPSRVIRTSRTLARSIAPTPLWLIHSPTGWLLRLRRKSYVCSFHAGPKATFLTHRNS